MDLSGGHHILPEDRVDERGLARARRPEQHARASGAQLELDLIQSFARHAAGHDDRCARGNGLELDANRIGRIAEICLGQDDRRHRTALPPDGEVPLDPAHIDVGRRHDNERDVDVGRQHLLFCFRARSPAGEDGAPFEDGADDATAERDPIADRRIYSARAGAFCGASVMNQVVRAEIGDDARRRRGR